jgi:hypothetical protein
MLQELMRLKAPEGVEIVEVQVRGDWDALEDCDRIVAASVNGMPPLRKLKLEQMAPVLWFMSPVHPHTRRLVDSARMVLWASEGLRNAAGIGPDGIICPGWWDTSEVPRDVPKEDFALWAGRDVPQKGEHLARAWAEQQGVELVTLKRRPRAEVLEHMGRARWFVMLPEGPFDPCPTTVIEAEIAGCEIIANDLVGRTPVRGAQANVEYIESLPDLFWSAVCR